MTTLVVSWPTSLQPGGKEDIAMRAMTNLLYTVAILAMVNLACGGPVNGDRDAGQQTVADGGHTPTLSVTEFSVDGEPTASSVTFNCSTDGDGAFRELDVYYGTDPAGSDWQEVRFDAPPYQLFQLTPASHYQAEAVAVCDNGVSSQTSAKISFTTGADPCAGLVVPLATKCSTDGLPPLHDFSPWSLQAGTTQAGEDVCDLASGGRNIFIMRPDMSGATRFTTIPAGGVGESWTCVE